MNKKGFTLLELLVVVLIIGILASIALPQYRVAVAKAKFVKGIALCDAIVKAQKAYHMANDKYSVRFDELVIELPAGATSTPETNGETLAYPDFNVQIWADNTSGEFCYTNAGELAYYHFYNGRKDCRAGVSKALKNKVCKSLTHDNNPQESGGQNIYKFQ